MRGVGDIGLVGDSFALGLGRVEDEFGDGSIAGEVFWTEQNLLMGVVLLWKRLRRAAS